MSISKYYQTFLDRSDIVGPLNRSLSCKYSLFCNRKTNISYKINKEYLINTKKYIYIFTFIFYNSDLKLTLAFVKNLCFSNSAAVGLNRRRDTRLFIIFIKQPGNLVERKTSKTLSERWEHKKAVGD